MDKVQINKSGGVCRLPHAAPKRRNALNTKMPPRRRVARMEPAEWFGPAETVDPPRAFTPRKVLSCRVSTDAQRLKPGKKGYYLVHTRQHR